jgi:hypothetical protein
MNTQMPRLLVDLTFSTASDRQNYTKEFDVDRDRDGSGLDFLSAQVFRECHMQVLYGRYRRTISNFETLSAGGNWFPGDATDLIRMAAHSNTSHMWFQIRNAFLEAAHLMAQARAYKDIEGEETDKEKRLLIHLIKVQFFNSAAYRICTVEDYFLLLLFLNSGCSLIPGVDVHGPNWMKEIKRGAINKALQLRKSERRSAGPRKSNPYLDALSDEDYRAIRSVFSMLGRPQSVRAIREYRHKITHRVLPSVDYPDFSPSLT